MAALEALTLTVCGFAAVLGGLVWFAAKARRSGVAGRVMGVAEEIWHPAAHEHRIEIQQHEQRLLPTSPRETP